MSLPRYNNYKDSGVKWLGKVPCGWGVRRIRHLFEIRKRICGAVGHEVLSITQQGIKAKDIENGDGQLSADYSKYQFVEVGDFAMNHMDLLTGYVDISPIFGVTSPDYRVFALREGLIKSIASCTNTGPSVVLCAAKTLNQTFLRDKEACFDKYYLYLFQAGYRNRIFYAFGQGSSQLGRWRFPTDEFNSFEFPFPFFEEQKEIATFLEYETAKIDALITEQERLIGLLKEKRQAVISHAVTKGLNPDVPMMGSGIEWLGKVPAHWQIRRLRFLCDINTGGKDTENAVENGSYPFFVRPQTIERIDSVAFDCEAILTAGDGAGVGKVFHYYNGPFDFHQRVYMLNNFREVSGAFLFHFLRENFYKVALEGGAKSTVDSLRRPVFMNFTVCIPPQTEQTRIVKTVENESSKFDALTGEAETAIHLLQERRMALISAAVTGKIDVRGLVAAQPEEEAAE